jgi:hypothetical protein
MQVFRMPDMRVTRFVQGQGGIPKMLDGFAVAVEIRFR